MKKLILLFLLVSISFGIVACNDEKAPVFKLKDGVETKLEINTEEPDWKTLYTTENISGDIKVVENVDMGVVGTYEVMYTYNYNGKEFNHKVYIYVEDSIAPVIAVDSSKPISFHEGSPKPNIPMYFSAVDNGDGEITITDDMILENIDMNKVGTYIVQLTVSDSAGNLSTESIKINIVDITNPIVYVNPNGLSTDFIVTEELLNSFNNYFEVIDNEDGIIEITDEMITHNIDNNTVGEYNVNLSVSDMSGNTATATLIVSVVEMPAPILSVESNNIQFGKTITVSADRKLTEYSLNNGDYISIENPSEMFEISDLEVGKHTIVFKGELGAVTESLTIDVIDTIEMMLPNAKSKIAYDLDGNAYDVQSSTYQIYFACNFNMENFEFNCYAYAGNESGYLFEVEYLISEGLYAEGSIFTLYDEESETTKELEIITENIDSIQLKTFLSTELEYLIIEGKEYLIGEYINSIILYNAYEYHQFNTNTSGIIEVYELENGGFYVPYEGDNTLLKYVETEFEEQVYLIKDGIEYLIVGSHVSGKANSIFYGAELILDNGVFHYVTESDESLVVVIGEETYIYQSEELIKILGYQTYANHEFPLGTKVILVDGTVITINAEENLILRKYFNDETYMLIDGVLYYAFIM